jgi:GNAT superfamily N-acetyltransferase
MAPKLTIMTRADSLELKKAAHVIEQAAWSELGYLNYTRAHYVHYAALLDEYPDYQMCLMDESGYPLAAANCVPLKCDDVQALPPEGWDWIVESAAGKHGEGANMLGALAISVPAVHRSKGYARIMINAMLDLARKKNLGGLIAPVRPSSKAQHPNVPIDDYITWTDERGRVYDPWLRSHVSAGGKIVRPCKRSMVVDEHVAFWETWGKKHFEESGDYLFDGALTPVHIDVEHQRGVYEEPNVWVAYAA